MKTLTVFDPAMCCSTGVCGPDVARMSLRLVIGVLRCWRQSPPVMKSSEN